MISIQMKKFGAILNGRPAGREAFLRMVQIINGAEGDIFFDFEGVNVLTPSFADEFITRLQDRYKDKEIKFKGVEKDTVVEKVLNSINVL